MEIDTRGWPVAGVAYGQRGQLIRDSAPLTHAVDWEAKRVLCGKVKFSNILVVGQFEHGRDAPGSF